MNMLPSVGRSEPLHNRGSKPSDGQIIKGKVIQLLNAKEAIVEISGRAIKASIEVPLKPGSSYLFQVFREPEGLHLKMIKEVGEGGITNHESVDETVRFLGLPADGRSRALVRLFFQHDWPLKSGLLTQARRLIGSSSRDDEWEALKTILEKKWPLKESLFKALVAVQDKQSAKALNTLLSELNQLNLASETHKELASMLENWPSIDEDGKGKAFLSALKTVGNNSEQEEALEKWLMRTFPEHSDVIHQSWPEARILLRKMTSPQDLKAFLNLIGLSIDEEQFYKQMVNSEFIKQSAHSFSNQWLKNILEKTGYFYEAELRKLAKDPAHDSTPLRQSLKGLLIALAQSDANGDNTIQQTIHHLLQHINGQQLQSLHMDRSFVQLIFTFPLRFQDQLQDVQLFWEGKRKADGSVDSNYCKIAFQLDLPHISDTVLHILVQERRVTIAVFNDHPLIENLIREHSTELTARMESLGYQLVSVKQHIGSMPEGKAVFAAKAGKMDVRI